METTTKIFMWEQIFLTHAHWEGTYEFEGRENRFSFRRLSVQPDFGGSVVGLFIDNHAKFELEGADLEVLVRSRRPLSLGSSALSVLIS